MIIAMSMAMSMSKSIFKSSNLQIFKSSNSQINPSPPPVFTGLPAHLFDNPCRNLAKSPVFRDISATNLQPMSTKTPRNLYWHQNKKGFKTCQNCAKVFNGMHW